MWSQVAPILEKFERVEKNYNAFLKQYTELTGEEMDILRDFFQPYLRNDNEIFKEICENSQVK